MAKEVISKRNFIHPNIIKELDTKYPLYSEKNGVAYSRDLKFISFEPSVDIDANIIALDVNMGFGVLNVIFYFAEEMMKGGYKVRIDGYNLERHCLTCYGKYGVPSDKVRQIVDALINCRYFFKIEDKAYQYLTTCQAVFDYERCMNTRMESRIRKQKSREKFKQQLEQAQLTQNVLSVSSQEPQYIPECSAQINYNQEYCYPDTCNQIYSFPDTYETYRQDCEISATCIDDFSEPDEVERMIQDEMAWREQQGITSECDEYEAPDPVGDMILEEEDWRMQHSLNCDDAIPDDDFDYPIPYSDVIAI